MRRRKVEHSKFHTLPPACVGRRSNSHALEKSKAPAGFVAWSEVHVPRPKERRDVLGAHLGRQGTAKCVCNWGNVACKPRVEPCAGRCLRRGSQTLEFSSEVLGPPIDATIEYLLNDVGGFVAHEGCGSPLRHPSNRAGAGRVSRDVVMQIEDHPREPFLPCESPVPPGRHDLLKIVVLAHALVKVRVQPDTCQCALGPRLSQIVCGGLQPGKYLACHGWTYEQRGLVHHREPFEGGLSLCV
mmetsp:Transcript_109284/g.308350  ORF Transcript_109284/g.308350 Transcript_109284/m.308350 type:complete len:242 (+) Transcript_109284:393-1118(+)